METDFKRKLIVEGLLKVEKSGFSHLVFSSLVENNRLSPQDKAFVAKIFYGTIERKITLNYVLQQFLTKPIAKMDCEVLAIMQSGLYQILYMNSVPAFAAINQAVSLCPVFKKTSAKGLVNAVLRKCIGFSLDKQQFANEETRLSVTYSVTPEILKIICRDYPDHVEQILESLLQMSLLQVHINTVKISVEEFCCLLDEKKIEYRHTELPTCLNLKYNGGVSTLPGFAQGYFFVQGITSQYAVYAAGIAPNNQVLDLCAAPGGKSFAAAIAMGASGTVISCDPNPSRLDLISQGAQRLGLNNIVTQENLGQEYHSQFINKDVVLCDVPCSGIGIIQKKPDLRYKSLKDIAQLCQLQYDILSTAAKYVKLKGRVVYSTCTINKDENEAVITKFLNNHPDFRLVEQNCPLQGAINDNNMITVLPGKANYDGFFIAVLEKV